MPTVAASGGHVRFGKTQALDLTVCVDRKPHSVFQDLGGHVDSFGGRGGCIAFQICLATWWGQAALCDLAGSILVGAFESSLGRSLNPNGTRHSPL